MILLCSVLDQILLSAERKHKNEGNYISGKYLFIYIIRCARYFSETSGLGSWALLISHSISVVNQNGNHINNLLLSF